MAKKYQSDGATEGGSARSGTAFKERLPPDPRFPFDNQRTVYAHEGARKPEDGGADAPAPERGVLGLFRCF